MDAVGNSSCATFCEKLADRRQFLRALGLAGIAASLPFAAHAAEGYYDAMLLSCIDPRMVTPVYKYMDGQGLAGKYSQFCIAGAAIAVVADKFKAWRPAFWDNAATTVQLHHIKRIIVIDHRDCGAAKIAYGEKSIATPEAETKTHKKALAEFREAVAKRHPKLTVVTALMALDGSIEIFT
jgi:carbonic anhydrase